MMSSTDPMRPEGEKLRQHANWAERHARLFRGPAPAERPQRPRPVSPFDTSRAVPPNAPQSQQRPIPTAPTIPVAAWRAIVAEVAEKHGVTEAMIIGPSRQRVTVNARHEAVFRIYTETKLSSTEIARRLGDRDHTTAINSIQWYCKQFPEALAVLAAAKLRRISDERTAVAHARRKARELQAQGKTVKQILGQVPLSESALYKALRGPAELSTGQFTEAFSRAVASENPREHMEDRCSTGEAVNAQ